MGRSPILAHIDETYVSKWSVTLWVIGATGKSYIQTVIILMPLSPRPPHPIWFVNWLYFSILFTGTILKRLPFCIDLFFVFPHRCFPLVDISIQAFSKSAHGTTKSICYRLIIFEKCISSISGGLFLIVPNAGHSCNINDSSRSWNHMIGPRRLR